MALRPSTTKISNFQLLRNLRARPQSAANKGLTMLPASKPQIEKSKSKKNYLSREEMLDRLHYFQSQSNQLREENLRLKTRIKFLEKDKPEDSEKSHLQISLKTQIKELQKTIENKEVEISELKKHSRATKMQEIEVEMKMYIDECTRLQRLLQEAYFQLGQGINPAELQQKFVQQSIQLKALKKDYKELVRLSEEGPLSKSKTKKELTIVKLKKNLMNTKEENLRVNEDNQRLVQELNSLRQNFRCPNCGFVVDDGANKDVNIVIWDIWQAIEHRKLDIERVWQVINPDLEPQINKLSLGQGLERLGLFLSLPEIEYFFPNNIETISKEYFADVLIKLRPADMVSYNDVKDTLDHISFRLQVRRYEYDQVSALFFNDKNVYNLMEVYSITQQEPLSLNEIQAELFTKFLFGSCESMGNHECSARFYAIIEPWEVLSEDEESTFDNNLKELIQNLGETLIKSLQVYDTANTGIITTEKFYEVMERCKVEINESMKKYLDLLFYTDQMEFNSVPYKNFYQAYSQN